MAHCTSNIFYRIAVAVLIAAAGAAYDFPGGVQPLHAQSAAQETRAAVYRYARPGQETMQVGVWGSVGQPGLYEVPTGTDLMNLLSIVGGPEVSLENARQRQKIIVRLVRGSDSAVSARPPADGGSHQLIFEARLDELTALSRDYPPLQSGDVLTIEKIVRERFSWRDAMSVFQAAGTVAIIILNTIRFSRD